MQSNTINPNGAWSSGLVSKPWLRFSRRVGSKDLKSWYLQLYCLTFSI